MKPASRVFKALCDETRFKLVENLLCGEKCVCELIKPTGRAQSTVSLQLRKLESEGIVESRRAGKNIYYQLKDPRVSKIFKVLGYKVNG
ncbi:MAG: winged helix-turn-helix transcriptional regulator [Candidatus Aenigmarchaeota archaeon]|nr:winged helix-turn-helix transcriptional regulator [Candidatus Aenigmarchaeota archaeon]